MLGTLNGALEVRGVSLAPDRHRRQTWKATNEVVEGVPVLTRVIVRYRLTDSGFRPVTRWIVPSSGTRRSARPRSASVAPYPSTWAADIEETP